MRLLRVVSSAGAVFEDARLTGFCSQTPYALELAEVVSVFLNA